MFFIELYCEEIPARMQKQAVQDWKSIFIKAFDAKGIEHKNVESFVSPQRLVLKADLADQTKAVEGDLRGPRLTAPDNALQGFLKANNVSKSDLIEKDGYYYLLLKTEPKNTKDLIPEILNFVLESMPWPKVMRYPQSKLSWVRPVRNIVCSLNETPLLFDVDLLGLKTTDYTFGHRFMAPASIPITTFERYQTDLEKAFVILDQNKRKSMILDGLKASGLTLVEDEGLLDEVTGLCEYPFVHTLNIDKAFMHLPDCVLTTSMRTHQKYFSFKKGDSLAPYFGVVANFDPTSKNVMKKGYETVLKARLSDASFFFETDLKTPLMDFLPKLDAIVYQAKLGTLRDKVNRLNACTTDPKLQEAILLSKCDLVTTMVGEFGELQGKMGRIYALSQGHSAEVASAIEEHYEVPTSYLGKELSLLDKLDALVGFLGIGLKPTGSKDPYALRRQALGVIRILLDDDYKETNLYDRLKTTLSTHKNLAPDAFENVCEFLLERFHNLMKNDFSNDSITAILNTTSDTYVNIWSLAKRIEAIEMFLKTQAGDALKQAYKRALGAGTSSASVDTSLFESTHEKKLFEEITKTSSFIEQHLAKHNYLEAMQSLSKLPINDFFENVLVNVGNQAVCQNRQALVSKFVLCTRKLVDFS